MKNVVIHISKTEIKDFTITFTVDDNISDKGIEEKASEKVADLVNWYWDMLESEEVLGCDQNEKDL